MNSNFKKFVISLYKPVKGLTIIMIGSMIVSQILDLMKQYIIKGIIDLPSMNNFNIGELYKVIFILLGVIILELIFYYISNITRTIHMVKKQTPYISEKLFSNLNRKTYSFFTDNYTGKISSAINEITNEVTNLNTQITSKFISLLTSMISSLIVLYTININIFITATILFTGIIISRLVYFSKKYLPYVQKAEEYNREYNGILNDAVLNFTSLRLYNSVEKFSKSLKSKKEEANFHKNKASSKEFAFGAIANVIYIIVLVILMIYSVYLFKNNMMTLGSFIFFINAMISLKSQTTSFTWSYIHIGEIMVKIKNSYDLLYSRNTIEDDNKQNITIKTGKIEFKDISFKYNKNYIFEDFNLTVNDRQKIGIIGISGSGKTTLVNLLFKFYFPQKGNILIDDKDISNYNTNSIYNNLTYVPQETILLHSSIYENIKIAKPDATNKEIINAAKKAELHDFIESLEDKYDTIVGERGIKLSGGQRQRIALARIFLRDSKIVIFDEATSSLDNNTEFKIQKNIHKYFKDQTIICIAHRLSTLKDMDNILVIEKGKIIDYGVPKYIIPKYDNKEFILENV
ncbi:MAG: ABC transporter ATP-binding protein [Clostridia bacterium]|nr:ABC transporter ATP-binding protein [Clostridia bacterium]